MKRTSGKIPLVAVGVALVAPLVLVLLVLVAVESRAGAPANADAGASAQLPSASYAQTFAMSIFEADRTVRLWLKDLDSAPYFRQTIEVDGEVVSDQLYRFDERTLYTAERGADGVLEWLSFSQVEPASLQLADLASGPAAWAAQYGSGEQMIPLEQGPLQVTIHSVDEIADAAAFELPQGADPVPANG